MRTHRMWAAAGALALSATVPVAAEDVTIVYALTENGQPKGTATHYISSERFRTSQPDSDLIVEYGSGRFVSIDHKKKEYWETTRDEMNAKLEEQQNQMQAHMPPALREKMGNLMGGIAASVTATPGNGSRKIAGYDTKPYTVAMGEMMKQELWNADITLPTPAMDARNSLIALNNPMIKDAAKLVEEMKKVKGLPLSETTTVKILTKTVTTSREATEVKKGPIEASAFALPTGYNKVESPLSKTVKQAK
ncbi:MAG: hypothetical protein ACREX8_20645 [Gammaproteobacteria bacterium]